MANLGFVTARSQISMGGCEMPKQIIRIKFLLKKKEEEEAKSRLSVALSQITEP